MTTDVRDVLTHRYITFINRETPWAFFVGLSDYIDYILGTPQFSWTIEREFAKRNSEYKLIETYEESTISEMDEVRDKLLGVIKKRKVNVNDFSREKSLFPSIRHPDAENIIEHMQMFYDGVINLNGFRSDNINNFLFDISANLLEMGYKKDVEEFIVPDKEYQEYYQRINGKDDELYITRNQRGNFIFSKTWPYRFEQVKKVETQRKLQLWGAFEEIIKIWHAKEGIGRNASMQEIFENCQNDEKYRLESDEIYDVSNIVADIKLILENHSISTSHLEYFRINELRPIVTRINTILIEKTSEEIYHEQIKSKGQTKAIQKNIEEFNQAILVDRIDVLGGTIKKENKNTDKFEINLDEIFYNNKTAIGDINGREFRFKPDSSTAEVFSSVWGIMNVPAKRQDVLIISGFYEEGQASDPTRRVDETYHINDIAKSIRRTLKINTKKLINNDGNLTLIGKKLKNSKLNQDEPR